MDKVFLHAVWGDAHVGRVLPLRPKLLHNLFEVSAVM